MNALTSALRSAAALTLVLVMACWAVWLAAGWLLDALQLDTVDVFGQVCLVFLFLSFAEIGLKHIGSRTVDRG